MAGQGERAPAPAALVTGAARRIGLRIAQRLAGAGYAVALHCSESSLDEAKDAAAAIVAAGGRAEALAADLADAGAVEALVTRAGALVGPLTLLVNSASIFEADGAGAFDPARFDRIFAVNLRAPCALASRFVAQAPQGADAVIVNIVDQRVLRLTPQFFSYTLSKAALWTATQTLAQSFAPLGVRANAVGPGPVAPNDAQGEAGFAQEVAGLPLKGPIDADAIADAVLYLAGARHVTGQMIAVDCGQHLAWATPDVILQS